MQSRVVMIEKFILTLLFWMLSNCKQTYYQYSIKQQTSIWWKEQSSTNKIKGEIKRQQSINSGRFQTTNRSKLIANSARNILFAHPPSLLVPGTCTTWTNIVYSTTRIGHFWYIETGEVQLCPVALLVYRETHIKLIWWNYGYKFEYYNRNLVTLMAILFMYF